MKLHRRNDLNITSNPARVQGSYRPVPTPAERGAYLRALLDEGKRSGKWKSYKAFAESADISEPTLWRLMKGETDLANADSLVRVAGAAGVPVEELVSAGQRPRDLTTVSVDEAGLPIEDELEQLREWLPDEMTRRMSRKLTPRVWLGMLYALGAEQHWDRARMGRIHAAMQRLDDEAERS